MSETVYLMQVLKRWAEEQVQKLSLQEFPGGVKVELRVEV